MKGILAVFALFSVLSGTYAFVQDSTWCPPEDDISPCYCSNNVLRCDEIYEAEVLRKVFGNSAGHSYEEIYISDSSFQYIPREAFDQVQVKKLYIKGSTFISLFDSPPQQPSLEMLEIAFTRIYRPSWNIFSSMTSLKSFIIINTAVKRLDKDFNDNMPKSLEEIRFHTTGLKSIKSGAFKDLVNLVRVHVVHSQISVLSRDVFPAPFIGKYLQFSGNHLTSIPGDLFTQMPNLVIFDLSNNKLTEIPEATKANESKQFQVLMLNGNPLNCDCKSRWFLKNGPKFIFGQCATPDAFKGREFRKIPLEDFDCEK